jgi:cytochrome bd-type quinol oxidase subunit 1
VQGLQKTVNANSPAVSATDIWISLTVFVLAYIVLGAADLILMLRYSRHGLAQADAEAAESTDTPGAVPALTY